MRKLWNKLKLYISVYTRPIVVVILLFGVLVSLYIFNLGGLLPGLSQPEVSSLRFSGNLDAIRYNPVNAPVTLLQHFVQSSRFNDIVWLRLISAMFGVVTVLAFYRILRHWFKYHVALLGTILFATSSWLLHSSRIATPLVLQTLVILLVLLGVEVQRSKGSKPTLFLGAVIVPLLLYIPGMIWLVLVVLIWQRKRIVRAMKRNEVWFMTMCLAIVVGLLLPLIFALLVDPTVIRELANIPRALPSVQSAISNIMQVPLQLFFRGPDEPVYWLGRLPLLEIFSTFMFVVGLYAYSKTWLLDRTKMVVGMLAVLWLLVSMNASVQITILLPIVFVVVVSGIAYMLEEWMKIFPKNPLARGTGIALMTLAVSSVVFYHTQSYFVAWPNTPETQAVFQLNKPE